MRPQRPASDDDRRRKLAAIHAAAAALGWDTADKSADSVYRTVLRTQAGVASAKDLTAEGRRKVLGYMLSMLQINPPGHVGMIERLWRDLGAAGALRDPSGAGLDAFVKARLGVDSHRWLDTKQANQVIEALKAWKARQAARA